LLVSCLRESKNSADRNRYTSGHVRLHSSFFQSVGCMHVGKDFCLGGLGISDRNKRENVRDEPSVKFVATACGLWEVF
jgi:hypothetical protein